MAYATELTAEHGGDLLPLGQIKPTVEHLPDLDAVTESIRKDGLLYPILVITRYEIVLGNTRYEAAKRLGYDSISAVICANLVEAWAHPLVKDFQSWHSHPSR